jgi:hypothetical protein
MWIPEVGGKLFLYVNIPEVKNVDQANRQKNVVHTKEKINAMQLLTIKTFISFLKDSYKSIIYGYPLVFVIR